MMKEPFEILEEAQSEIEEFLQWQNTTQQPKTWSNYAEDTSTAAEVLKYATVLYPKFIKVEGFIVVAEHYEEANWRAWREKLDARHAAQLINHVHLEDLLYRDYVGVKKLEEHVGDMIAFFWKMAVDHQFPDDDVSVEYNGDVINIYQAPL